MATELMRKADYARSLDVAASQLSRWIRLGLPVTPEGLIDRAAADKWRSQIVRKRGRPKTKPTTSRSGSNGSASNGADSSGQSLADFRRRHEAARAQLAELQLQERRNELVSRVLVENQIAELATGLRQRLMRIPARIAPRLAVVGDVREARTILDDAIREALS